MTQMKGKSVVNFKPSDLEGLKSKRADLTPLDFKPVDLTGLDLRVSGLKLQSQGLRS